MSSCIVFARGLIIAVALMSVGGCGELFQSAVDELRGAPNAQQLARQESFSSAGFSFSYPALFRQRQEFAEGTDFHWTFTLRRAEIELLAVQYDVHVDDWLLSGAESFGVDPDRAVESIGSIALCGQVVEGRRVTVEVLCVPMTMDAYKLNRNDGSLIVAVSDEASETRRPSPEAAAFLEQLTASATCG